MQKKDSIAAQEFCIHHNIELSFISSLQNFGLIEVQNIEDAEFIPATQLQKLETFIRMHYDLDINPEGIDAIANLLYRVKIMQNEITALKNKLDFYQENK